MKSVKDTNQITSECPQLETERATHKHSMPLFGVTFLQSSPANLAPSLPFLSFILTAATLYDSYTFLSLHSAVLSLSHFLVLTVTPTTTMAVTHFVFFFLFFISFSTSSSTPLHPYPYGLAYHIDCGSATNSTDPFNTTWLSDRFYTGGATSIVSEPLRFHYNYEKTLRFFPISYGKKNCYVFPSLPAGRYFFSTFVVYDNYDGKSHPPSFDVSVEGTVVFSWRSPWPESTARDGAYSDLFAYVKDGEADVCFYSLATDPPVISSVELVQVDSLSYDSVTTGKDLVLVNYGRLSCGSDSWGPGFSNDTDLFGRSWQSDSKFRSNSGSQDSISRNSDGVRTISTSNTISGTDVMPNYFPMKLYQSATVGRDGALEYKLNVDAKLDYLLWLHFAEIDSSVKKAGDRIFDVVINDKNVTRIDIYKQVGSFAAYSWHYTVKNLSSSVLSVKLEAAVGAPLISGLENYALVPNDPSTVPEQGALKESRGIYFPSPCRF